MSNKETSAGEKLQGGATRRDQVFLDITTALGRRSSLRRRSRRLPFSSLTGKIVTLNLLALAILVSGILYLNQFREGLIEARINALRIQAEIMAGAIGEASGPEATVVDKAVATQILRRLVVPTQTRARMFDGRGHLISDSRRHVISGQILAQELPPPDAGFDFDDFIDQSVTDLVSFFSFQKYPQYVDTGDAESYAEVIASLNGLAASAVRQDSKGDLILSVAVPVKRFKAILGSLMLTTEAGDIDRIVREERLVILGVALIAGAATIFLSVVLAGTIAQPIHRLAEAVDHVRTSREGTKELPDFSWRRDEIGDLSIALRDMTEALYNRIDVIDRFAADVSHEIKNPLTSIRSAVETLDLAKTEEQKERLLQVIREDVGRIDRLISDISDASRLDAELSRAEVADLSVANMIRSLTDIYNDTRLSETGPKLQIHLPEDDPLVVSGIEDRLGQVLRNLIDNAITFSPEDGEIRLSARREDLRIKITVEDQGPGIPPENLETVFERFYTERPETEAFGKHSGLGLSICKQIVQAHGGTIRAENRREDWDGGADKVLGARFVIKLPARKQL